MNWLFVLGEAAAIDWVLEHETMAFREHVDVTEIRKGDGFVLYATRGAFHNPSRDEARVFGHGLVATAPTAREQEIAGGRFTSECKLNFTDVLPPRESVPFKPLIPELSFIRNKTNWSMYVRRTIVPLTDSDFATLRQAIEDTSG